QPLPILWPPFPDPIHDTQARDHAGQAPHCAPAPVDSRGGAAQVARAPFPPFAPCPRLRAQWGRRTGTPPFSPSSPFMSNRRPEHHPRLPPPLLTRERGLHRRGHPTRSHAMGARQVSPPRLPRSRANRTHACGTNPPPPQPPLPFARKGGEAQELGAARDRTRDAGRRGGRHAHRPFPLLTGDPTRNARGGATAPSPGLRAEATRK
ncbi:hypothetical protein EDB83DRAFT_2633267, partial [Lactarius deliciosus]